MQIMVSFKLVRCGGHVYCVQMFSGSVFKVRREDAAVRWDTIVSDARSIDEALKIVRTDAGSDEIAITHYQ